MRLRSGFGRLLAQRAVLHGNPPPHLRSVVRGPRSKRYATAGVLSVETLVPESEAESWDAPP